MEKRGASRTYGPVPSRRFGLSLGVDLVPPKTCTLDCIYCQAGPTTCLTTERRDFYPLDEVLADIEAALAEGPRPNVITLAGNGEPTLYRSLGKLIRGIRARTDIPVLLLTNATLFHRPDVARDVLEADLLAPSLDASDEGEFREVNRPHPELTRERLLEGLRDVANRFTGPVHLEVMLLRGINDSAESLAALSADLRDLPVTTVDINTVVRPPASAAAERSRVESLEAALAAFGPRAQLIAAPPGRACAEGAAGTGTGDRRILDLISRRPCTLEDLVSALGSSRAEVLARLEPLARSGLVVKRLTEEDVFYVAERGPAERGPVERD